MAGKSKQSPEQIARERIAEAKRNQSTRLDLSNLGLTALPTQIGELTSLTMLDLLNTQLTAIPAEIGKLISLTTLDLGHNQLTALPTEIEKLTSLTTLLLDSNQLTALPTEIGKLTSLAMLILAGNPLTDPPPEVVSQGTDAVLAYLRDRKAGSQRQWTAKLLVVGEGGVGKTCLLDALHGRKFDNESETTHGISVQPLEIPHPTEDDVTMTLNAWDFGGQEIYHATHQFFLTNRSLFVLAWNARLGWKQGRLDYWLETIHALAPDSPVLIVATHIDERSAELPFDDLKRKYPHIVNRVEVSSKQPRSGIDQLRSAVALAAADLPLMGVEWPADWVSAADAVRARKENQIGTQDLMTLFTKHGVADDSRRVLARALHELGDILHFEDDKELGDTVLLNPQWVTENISRVLEHDAIVEGLGIFRRSHMKVVWEDVDEGTRERFLRLMEKFDLSYRIPDDVRNRSLIVERLSQDPSEYQSKWDAIVQREGCKEISMKFDLTLPRPAGIPTWFIARSHRFTTHTHWLYGALFADDRDEREYKHLALLLAPPADEGIVTLTVRGPSPHSFFALLRDGLELTLGRFAGLRDQIKRTMPCPGHHGAPCTHSFDFAQVQKAIERESPVLEMQCPVAFKNVSVPHLLFGIHGSTQDAVLERIEKLDRANAERHSESMAELAGLRELTQREFTNLFNRDQRLAESHCPRVFSLRPTGRKSWPAVGKLLGSKWNLQLYCEYPGCWHPTQEGGLYEIKKPGKWINDLAPHVQGLIKVLKFVAPIAGPWLAYSLPQLAELLKKDVDLMKGLVDGLGELDVHADRDLTREYGIGETGSRKHVEGASLRGLRKLLDELDHKQHWGGLRKLLTPEGHYLWLCEHHYKAYEQ